MRHFRQLCVTAALVLVSMHTWAIAAPTLTVFDIPNSAGTRVNGTNNRGDIVGVFDAEQRPRPYVFSHGTVTILDIAATFATPLGINDRGQIVGFMGNSGSAFSGFLWDRGTVTQFEAPDSAITYFHGINNRGQIVGHARHDIFALARPFVWADGIFTFLDIPGVVTAGETRDSLAINDRGQIVGSFQEGGPTRGFLLSDGELTRIQVPAATFTWASGINNKGEIVGSYREASGPEKVYLRHPDGSFTTIDIPGASLILGVDINDGSDIVGTFSAPGGGLHGFLWTR